MGWQCKRCHHCGKFGHDNCAEAQNEKNVIENESHNEEPEFESNLVINEDESDEEMEEEREAEEENDQDEDKNKEKEENEEEEEENRD